MEGIGDRDKGQQISMDLKSKQCPVGEFSTGFLPPPALPTSLALYYPKETSSVSHFVFGGPGESSANRDQSGGWGCGIGTEVPEKI